LNSDPTLWSSLTDGDREWLDYQQRLVEDVPAVPTRRPLTVRERVLICRSAGLIVSAWLLLPVSGLLAVVAALFGLADAVRLVAKMVIDARRPR
jgi:hypothetical protein